MKRFSQPRCEWGGGLWAVTNSRSALPNAAVVAHSTLISNCIQWCVCTWHRRRISMLSIVRTTAYAQTSCSSPTALTPHAPRSCSRRSSFLLRRTHSCSISCCNINVFFASPLLCYKPMSGKPTMQTLINRGRCAFFQPNFIAIA